MLCLFSLLVGYGYFTCIVYMHFGNSEPVHKFAYILAYLYDLFVVASLSISKEND